MTQPLDYCQTQCTTDTCSAYVPPNEVWNYNGGGFAVTPTASSAIFPTGAGSKCHDENIDRLAGSINDERARRGIGSFSFTDVSGSDEGGGTHPSSATMDQIKLSINQIYSGYVTYYTRSGIPISASKLIEARTKIDSLRSNCLCNTDCGGNTWCDCHNDCGCNY